MAKFYAVYDLKALVRQWIVGLRNLTFPENFNGYEWEGTIPFGEEVTITHPLKVVPTRFIITRAIGSNTIVLGDRKATATHIYLKNTGGGMSGSVDFTGKILIMP